MLDKFNPATSTQPAQDFIEAMQRATRDIHKTVVNLQLNVDSNTVKSELYRIEEHISRHIADFQATI